MNAELLSIALRQLRRKLYYYTRHKPFEPPLQNFIAPSLDQAVDAHAARAPEPPYSGGRVWSIVLCVSRGDDRLASGGVRLRRQGKFCSSGPEVTRLRGNHPGRAEEVHPIRSQKVTA